MYYVLLNRSELLSSILDNAVIIFQEIVREKKEGLKEAMKMMGLSNWVHWFSWFAKNFIFLAISCVMLTILLKVSAHYFLVFIAIVCYTQSSP